jgi:hypothetical protein
VGNPQVWGTYRGNARIYETDEDEDEEEEVEEEGEEEEEDDNDDDSDDGDDDGEVDGGDGGGRGGVGGNGLQGSGIRISELFFGSTRGSGRGGGANRVAGAGLYGAVMFEAIMRAIREVIIMGPNSLLILQYYYEITII